ncbi:hypothetical protein ACSAGD_01635 [Paramicrobacterium sp. CJ85]|uniref:baeRF2 domain-containing protein n=1 Tax=Paramicrobacterium sp. CJ85 TaxID=3445355 RepID=UPI003F642E79
MTLTADRETVVEISRDPQPKSVVHINSSAGNENPESTREIRRKRVRETLEAAGAPAADIEVIDDELREPTGYPDPTSRYIIAQGGELRVSSVLTGEMTTPEIIRHATVADVRPLVRQIPDITPLLLVQVWRGGGSLRLMIEGVADPVLTRKVEGDTGDLNKVSVGRMSEAGHQRHVEEVWKHNQRDVADCITEFIAAHHPRSLFVWGDVRAVQMLTDQLSDQAKQLLHVIPGETNSEGASEKRVRHAIDTQLEADRRRANRRILDRASADNGAHLARGVGEVAGALGQHQVDHVLIDPTRLAEHTLLALDATPWVAAAPEDAINASVLEKTDAATAIVRAALCADARVRFIEPDELDDGISVVASLRWPVGPARP